MNIIKNKILLISEKLAIDSAVFYSVLGRLIQTVGSLVTLFFLAKNLSQVEQGFYYTFGSLLAVQIFFELGMNSVISQYAAKEVSSLQLIGNEYKGENRTISRLTGLLHFCVKTNIFLAVILYFSLVAIGFFYFYNNLPEYHEVNWNYPWLVLALSTSLTFFTSPIMSFLEGIGEVKFITKFRIIQLTIFSASSWIFLSMGAKLYSSGMASILGSLTLLFIVVLKYKSRITWLWKQAVTEKISYFDEIFPYQWRIAISWISGYLIFQLFNPIVFSTDGPITAGKLGMTLAALNAILSISYSWTSTKVPQLTVLIARESYFELDKLFKKTIIGSGAANLFLLISFLIFLLALDFFNVKITGTRLIDRFLSFELILILCVPIFLGNLTGAFATYLRCHNKEPLLINSIVMAALTCLSTLVFGRIWGVWGVVVGYSVITALMFPWGLFVFVQKRKEWHGD